MKFLAPFALLLAFLAVPPRVPAVENALNAQVLAAIQAAEASRGREFPRGNCVGTLQIGAALPQDSAAVVVTQIRYDAALGQTRFLLHSRNNRKAPPFYAWCSYPTDAARPALSATEEDAALGPVLVDPHRSAQLFLHSEHGSALLTVRPLQSGRKDELIRVRLPLHGKMIQARVARYDALEASF